ncbi:MAG TPA: FAD-dependent oxidoreductase [Chitinophagaceae bacterium]|mgnify:CR=1 FL=1|nr:FAD-dependent oxidoreductase [Chitinophagaceae bacterium]
MRLRTYESFWLLKNGLLYTYPMLQQDMRTEVVVVGGGITGALISDRLVADGHEVILLDKRDIATGSTSATTSMLQYEIDEPLIKLSAKIGEPAAAACYRAGIAAIGELEKLVKRYGIDCGFARKSSLYIAHSKKAAKELYQEYLARNKHKLGVQWLEAGTIAGIYGLECQGGILSDSAASVDAYRLAHELINRNTKKGLQVYDQTTIRHIGYRQRTISITTAAGYTVHCNKIIFCNGYEATKMLQEKIAKLFYTYACVSEENIAVPASLKHTLVWDTNDPYLYLRTTDDGRLLVGGEDSNRLVQAGQQRRKEIKSRRLTRKAERLIPGLTFTEDFSWGGVFGSTKDGLPYIGSSPECRNAYFVLGFGGNGITFSIQGRQIINDLMAGKKNELANHYRFGR